jgi:hypothetical protein
MHILFPGKDSSNPFPVFNEMSRLLEETEGVSGVGTGSILKGYGRSLLASLSCHPFACYCTRYQSEEEMEFHV